MIYLLCSALLLAAMALTLYRAIKGEGWYDRILAGNSFSTQIILLISVYFYSSGYPEYIDIALLYALINYVGTLALMNYFRSKRQSDERHS